MFCYLDEIAYLYFRNNVFPNFDLGNSAMQVGGTEGGEDLPI